MHDIDRPRTSRSRFRRASLVGALAALAILGVACGGDDDGNDIDATSEAGSGGGDDTATDDTLFDQESLGVPDECVGVFPFAMEAPDADEVDLAPAGWPEPPEGATLCVTSETIGGETETAEFATSASAEDVLAYYEGALSAELNVTREAGVGEEILTGYDDNVGFQISPLEGGFRISYGKL